MELRLTARRGENVLVTIVIPVVVLLFFATAGILPTGGGAPVDFLLPGALALAVIATSLVNLGIATAYERNYGVLKRLGGSPLTRGGLLAAKMGDGPRRRGRPGRPAGGDRGRSSSAGRPGRARRRSSSSSSLLLGTRRSPGSGCCSPARSGRRRRWRSPTACSSRSCCSAGSSSRSRTCPEPLAALATVLPAAALADAFRVALGSGAVDVDLGPVVASILAVWAVVTVGLAVRTFRWE